MVNVEREQCEVYGTAPPIADVGDAPWDRGKPSAPWFMYFFFWSLPL